MPLPALALAGILGGALKSAIGIGQTGKGNRLLNSLQYPTEQLPDEYTQNQNLAQTMASTGMPSEQYNLAMKNIQRQQLAALRASNDRRGGLIAVPGILKGTNDATLALDANNAAVRQANQRNLLTVNNQVAGVKRDLFDKNIRDKYIRDYNYAQSLRGMGKQNLFGGIDQGLGGLVGLLGRNKNTSNSYNLEEPEPHYG